MSDKAEDVKVKEQPKEKKSNIVCVGLDIGTMNLVSARSDTDDVRITRNVFLQVDKDDIPPMADISYIESGDGETYVIGSHAFGLANMLGQQVSRPMEKGLISSKEINAIDVLTLMIKDLIGNTKDKEVYCSFSVPAEAIDEERSVTFHEKVFGRILGSLGVNHSAVNEAMAIIFSECSQEKFSGIGISFGAGMTNVAISYKGMETLKFSTARAGDWIDRMVAADTGAIQNRVTNKKEKYMKLKGEVDIRNKKDKRMLEALFYYYTSLIDYTIKKMIIEFNSKVDIELEEKIPIVVSGGTSLPQGFVELFDTEIKKHELPFDISEVRRAKNPLTAVANGLLVRTMADVKGKL
jgi:hypothetical protein